MKKHFLIVSYDITNTKKRTKLNKLLKGFGTHVQLSVFECELTHTQIDTMKRLMEPHIDTKTDNVRIYYLSSDDIKRIDVLAGRGVARDPIMYYV